MLQTVSFAIEGMSCQARVKAVLTRLPGVTPEQVKVGSAEVTFDDAQTSAVQIYAELTAQGYPAQPQEGTQSRRRASVAAAADSLAPTSPGATRPCLELYRASQ